MRRILHIVLLAVCIVTSNAQFPFGQFQGGFPFGPGGFPFDMGNFMGQMQGMTSRLQGMGARMSMMGQQMSQQARRQAQRAGVSGLGPGEFRQINDGNTRGFAFRSPDGSSSSYSFSSGSPGGGIFYTFGPGGVAQFRRF